MRFVAISSPTGQVDEQDQDDDMDAEVANGRRLYELGFLVQGYMDPGYTTAYFLVEAASAEAAQQHLSTYPRRCSRADPPTTSHPSSAFLPSSSPSQPAGSPSPTGGRRHTDHRTTRAAPRRPGRRRGLGRCAAW